MNNNGQRIQIYHIDKDSLYLPLHGQAKFNAILKITLNWKTATIDLKQGALSDDYGIKNK